MGEKRHEPFQLSFHKFLRVEFQGSRVTSDGGLVLVRELDERLGLTGLMQKHLVDSRTGRNTQLPLAGVPSFCRLSRDLDRESTAGPEGLERPVELSDPQRQDVEKAWLFPAHARAFEPTLNDMLARPHTTTGVELPLGARGHLTQRQLKPARFLSLRSLPPYSSSLGGILGKRFALAHLSCGPLKRGPKGASLSHQRSTSRAIQNA